MKLRLTLLLAFPFFFTLSTISLNAAVDTLTILHVNDTHSCLAPLAPRNPDFDLTPAILDTACHYGLTPAGIPLLSANLVLDDPSVQDLKNFIKPYIIKEYDSMKVGIFGLTTPSTNIFSQP